MDTKIGLLVTPRDILTIMELIDNYCLSMERFVLNADSAEEIRLWKEKISEADDLVMRCRMQYLNYLEVWTAREEANRIAAALEERRLWDDYDDSKVTQ